MIITDELARRLEIAEALDGIDCAEASVQIDPDCGVNVKAVAGGFCVYCGVNSPLSHALAIGLHGPVSTQDILEIEEFFRSRGAAVVVDVVPHCDPSLRELLTERRYRLAEMNNVLVRRVEAGEQLPSAASGIRLREAGAEESDVYSRTVMCGFFSREELTEEEVRLGHMLFAMPEAIPLLAEVDGSVAGGCGLSVRRGVASLFGDAVLERYRRRGVHTATILERLRRAAAAGCDLATAGTQPGSGSQRNYQRLGFDVAYTKATMVRE